MSPSLIVGMPVGFVGVEKSKTRLKKKMENETRKIKL